MIPPVLIPTIRVIVPIPTTPGRTSVPIIAATIVVAVIPVIILIVGVGPKNEGSPSRDGHLGVAFRENKNRQKNE